MEITNNTFSAAIRKYEKELKTEETGQTQETNQENSVAIKEFAEQQLAQTQNTANPNGDCFIRADGNATTISNINIIYTEPLVTETAKKPTETSLTLNKVSDYSQAELDYIKQMIYNSHHSFIANFRDTDTFFEYVNSKKDSSITKETGISRAQLIALTQNDKWEDNHKDFFGSLNRSFYSLDNDNNGTLSYDEVKSFLDNYLKKDGYSNFKTQVQNYSDEIQEKFDNASGNPKEKIQLIVDYTRDYLEAAGLTNHINALDRLLGEEDKFTDANHHIGNISFRDLNENKDETSTYITTGGYTSMAFGFEYTNQNTNQKPTGNSNSFTQSVSIFSSEIDTDENDLGLSFDISLLEAGQHWEYLVSVLVHELTHATMAQYTTLVDADNGIMTITESNLSALQRMGVFSDEEYETVKAHLKDINAKYGRYMLNENEWLGGATMYSDGKSIYNSSEMSKDDSTFLTNLLYKIDAARGEYMAYQADADYLDSVGGDIFSADLSKTAVNGDKEQEKIIKWINDSGYNDNGNQPLPDWKWWSYA